MSNVKDQELAKFRNKNNETFVAVTTGGDVSGLLSGVKYDDIQVVYPTSTTESYQYFNESILQATILITYTDASKKTLLRAQRF